MRAGIDDWLFEECYQAVGDLAETIAHVLPPPRTRSTTGLAEWVEQRLLPLRGMPPDEIGERLVVYWDELDWSGRFLLTKLIGGGFRVGVSRLLVTRALAEIAGVEPKTVAQRIVGYTGIAAMPSAARFSALIASGQDGVAEAGQPYPFFLAHQLNDAPDTLGPVDEWMVEWKWDGIRGQLVKRAGSIWLWSRGEDLVTARFPELRALESRIPDGTVIDGEIVVWKDGRVRPFAALQTRIGRKSLSGKILKTAPICARCRNMSAARASRRWCLRSATNICSSRRCCHCRRGRRTRACAPSRARAASKDSCSSGATRATVWAGRRSPAPGGNGRSIR